MDEMTRNQEHGYKWWKDERGICVDLEFSPIIIDVEVGGVQMDVEFDLTAEEYERQTDMLINKTEVRRQDVARYYFAMDCSIREIADKLSVPRSTIHHDITQIRKDVLGKVKKDIRTNKKVLAHLVELMLQVQNRVRELWKEYEKIEDELALLKREIKKECRNIPKENSKRRIALLSNALKMTMVAQERKCSYLTQLREETKMMLIIWERFGLCSNDAMDGGVDIDKIIKDVQEFLVQVAHIIRQEVTDEEVQHRIFGRMTEEMRKTHCLEQENTQVDID